MKEGRTMQAMVAELLRKEELQWPLGDGLLDWVMEQKDRAAIEAVHNALVQAEQLLGSADMRADTKRSIEALQGASRAAQAALRVSYRAEVQRAAVCPGHPMQVILLRALSPSARTLPEVLERLHGWLCDDVPHRSCEVMLRKLYLLVAARYVIEEPPLTFQLTSAGLELQQLVQAQEAECMGDVPFMLPRPVVAGLLAGSIWDEQPLYLLDTRIPEYRDCIRRRAYALGAENDWGIILQDEHMWYTEEDWVLAAIVWASVLRISRGLPAIQALFDPWDGAEESDQGYAVYDRTTELLHLPPLRPDGSKLILDRHGGVHKAPVPQHHAQDQENTLRGVLHVVRQLIFGARKAVPSTNVIPFREDV